jgi:hypothetical protein
VHLVSSTEAAELTKLYENTFRAVNIARANEVADACGHLGLDPIEVTDAAATKPYGYMPFFPGRGVGGHCIPCATPLRADGHPMPLVRPQPSPSTASCLVSTPEDLQGINDPEFEAKQARVLELYAIADGHVDPGPGDPDVVICLDEFGPLNLQPHPARQWARRVDCPGERRRRRRATYKRPHGVRQLLVACDQARPALQPHQDPQRPHRVLGLLPLHPLAVPARRAAAVRAGQPQPASDDQDRPTSRRLGCRRHVELAYIPFYASWLNRIETQFIDLRYFALDGTDHPDHATQGRMIRRYISLAAVASSFGACWAATMCAASAICRIARAASQRCRARPFAQ